MPHEEFGEIGFTNEDRKALYKQGVQIEFLLKQIEANDKRFDKVEGNLVTRVEHSELIGVVKDQGLRLSSLEKMVWKAVAYASGASAVVFTILKLIWH